MAFIVMADLKTIKNNGRYESVLFRLCDVEHFFPLKITFCM